MQRQNMQTDDVVRGADSALADIFYGLLRDVGARTKLTSNDRMLAELSALMGCGAEAAFRAKLADALGGGLSPAAAREAVMQSAAYLGMGRALPFVQAASEIFRARGEIFAPEKNDARERAVRGEEMQVQIFGDGMRGFHASGDALTRPVNLLLSENCFGDYYVREGLSLRERELVTFCLLASQGGCEAQLAGHIAGNRNVGNDASYLGEVIVCILPWIGYPRSLNALTCLKNAQTS